MNKVLLKKFLGQGILVASDIAEEITENDYEKTMIEPRKPTFLDKITLREIRRKQKITVISNGADKREIAAKDFLEYYKNKIKLLGPFILEKLGEKPVSINKMRPGQRNTVLGIVRDPGENNFYLEDLTGRCEIVSKAPDVKENDVVAVNGIFSGQKIFVNRVIHPELPIKKEIKKTESKAKIFFGRSSGNAEEIINKLRKDGTEEKCVFIIDTTAGAKELAIAVINSDSVERKSVPATPAKITSLVGGNNFKTQFIQAANGPIEMLGRDFSKRRYVIPENSMPPPARDMNVIDEDADIVFLGEAENSEYTNYKGYTFVTAGDRFVVIELQTRQTSLADF